MGMTLTEKILAAHCDRKELRPGELINCRVDFVLANDVTAPLAIGQFRRLGVEKPFDPQRVAMVPSHFAPNKDIKSAENAKAMREFALEQGIVYYEQGRAGIEHVLLPDDGWVLPGDVVVGADSHTCTYGALGAFSTGMGSTDIAAAMATGETWLKVPATQKFIFNGGLRQHVMGKDLILFVIGMIGVDGALYEAMEFAGEAIGGLSMDGRLSMCNMAIEAGGKSGIIEPDEKVRDYVEGRGERTGKFFTSDADAGYAAIHEIDASAIEPQVALPHLPSNARPVSEVGDIKLDQVVIGSCTNGRLEDLRVAAKVLRGKKVHPDVRLIVIPATQHIMRQAMHEGLVDVFIEAEGAVSTPTCGPCLGGHMGILAAGERALATTNRNFVGRMGHPKSEVYLSNPAVAAASAIAGRIVAPE